MHDDIIRYFPEPPGLPDNISAYLKAVDDIYVTDACHSLSIEGYRASEVLTERVRERSWSPESNEADREQRDAMAARDYWLAFNAVKNSVEKILTKENFAEVAAADHGD